MIENNSYCRKRIAPSHAVATHNFKFTVQGQAHVNYSGNQTDDCLQVCLNSEVQCPFDLKELISDQLLPELTDIQ